MWTRVKVAWQVMVKAIPRAKKIVMYACLAKDSVAGGGEGYHTYKKDNSVRLQIRTQALE